MIEISDLTFGYSKKETLFDNLNLNMSGGHVYGLLGRNGAGKTSLIMQIVGLLLPDSGNIFIDNCNSKDRSKKFLSTFFFVPEEFKIPNIKKDRFVRIYAPFYENFDKNLFDELLEKFSLSDDKKISDMSYGQKKKFMISFALACNTKVLIMDEPTNGLDIPSKIVFRNIIDSLKNQNNLFIISTHQIRDIEPLIDNIVILDNGKIKFNNTTEEVLKKLSFRTTDKIQNINNYLFSQEIPGGFSVIEQNTNSLKTEIDAEVFFNYVISGSDILKYFD